jgi:benzoyl-CoA 2,3-epoxidase subunit A
VVGNVRVTEVGTDYDTHHIVLDFGAMPFPVLEGQSIGIVPPGTDAHGRPHHARQYSIASPRNGERPGYNNLSLTVKRVLEDHQGPGARRGQQLRVRPEGGRHGAGDRAVRRQLPDAQPPEEPHRDDLHRHRQRADAGDDRVAPPPAQSGKFEGGKLMLFFGARTKEELPYFGPLQSLPKDFIDINLAFSRTPGQPKRYVQDLMRERAADLAPLLADPNAHFYVCGLKAWKKAWCWRCATSPASTGTRPGWTWDMPWDAALKRRVPAWRGRCTPSTRDDELD